MCLSWSDAFSLVSAEELDCGLFGPCIACGPQMVPRKVVIRRSHSGCVECDHRRSDSGWLRCFLTVLAKPS